MEIVTISADDNPTGDCEEQKGFFLSGFPIHIGDFGPIHPFTIIPTAGGEASVAAAQPRFGAVGGQPHHDHSGDPVGGTSTGGCPPQWGCVERSLG